MISLHMVALSLKFLSLRPCLFKLPCLPPWSGQECLLMLVGRGSLPPPACAAKAAVSPVHLFALCSPGMRTQLQELSVVQWTCVPVGAAGVRVCSSATSTPLSPLLAAWGSSGSCGPLAFLQPFWLPFPSLLSRQDFLLRNLSWPQSLSVSAPRLQGVPYKYPQSSEEPQALAAWVPDLSVTPCPKTPPGQMLPPGSLGEGELVYLELA